MKNVKGIIVIAIGMVCIGLTSCSSDDDGARAVAEATACERQAEVVSAAAVELAENPSVANCERYNEEARKFNEMNCGTTADVETCSEFDNVPGTTPTDPGTSPTPGLPTLPDLGL